MTLYMHKKRAEANTGYVSEFLGNSTAVEAIKSARQSLESKFVKYEVGPFLDQPPPAKSERS
jgi:hypothetical protein